MHRRCRAARRARPESSVARASAAWPAMSSYQSGSSNQYRSSGVGTGRRSGGRSANPTCRYRRRRSSPRRPTARAPFRCGQGRSSRRRTDLELQPAIAIDLDRLDCHRRAGPSGSRASQYRYCRPRGSPTLAPPRKLPERHARGLGLQIPERDVDGGERDLGDARASRPIAEPGRVPA